MLDARERASSIRMKGSLSSLFARVDTVVLRVAARWVALSHVRQRGACGRIQADGLQENRGLYELPFC